MAKAWPKHREGFVTESDWRKAHRNGKAYRKIRRGEWPDESSPIKDIDLELFGIYVPTEDDDD